MPCHYYSSRVDSVVDLPGQFSGADDYVKSVRSGKYMAHNTDDTLLGLASCDRCRSNPQIIWSPNSVAHPVLMQNMRPSKLQRKSS